MPANRFNGFTDYGIGIGLRIPHSAHIFEKKPVVDWFEIISENYMIDGGRPLATLDLILERYRVVQHGVSMYFGSAEPLNREHLRRLKALYIDCGSSDQYRLLYGARRFARRLAQLGIEHRYEEFPDNHSTVDYRMDESLPFLARALS